MIAPNDVPGFKVRRGPVAFGVKGGAADENDGVAGAVGLFLIESGTETVVDGGVAIQAERAGIFGDEVPVRVD